MSHLVYHLDDGGVIVLETENVTRPEGPIPASRLEDAFERAELSLEKSLDSICGLAHRLVTKLREAGSETPAEIDLSFGLKASAELQGFMIAKASAEANFSVSVKWKNPQSEKPQ